MLIISRTSWHGQVSFYARDTAPTLPGITKNSKSIKLSVPRQGSAPRKSVQSRPCSLWQLLWVVVALSSVLQQSCKNVPTAPTSWCYFFWPVLIFGKSTQKTGENTQKHAKTGENTQKQAKSRRFFGANFFGGKIGRC